MGAVDAEERDAEQDERLCHDNGSASRFAG
jgi:hypothetical protein